MQEHTFPDFYPTSDIHPNAQMGVILQYGIMIYGAICIENAAQTDLSIRTDDGASHYGDTFGKMGAWTDKCSRMNNIRKIESCLNN